MKHATISSMLLAEKPLRGIARKLQQNPWTLSRTVKRMERNGYTTRQFRSHHNHYSLMLLGYSLLDMIRTKGDKGNATGSDLTGSVIRATPTEKSKRFLGLHAFSSRSTL